MADLEYMRDEQRPTVEQPDHSDGAVLTAGHDPGAGHGHAQHGLGVGADQRDAGGLQAAQLVDQQLALLRPQDQHGGKRVAARHLAEGQ